MGKSKGYTAYVVRNTGKRQYLNDRSARGERWGRLEDSTVFENYFDATRTAFYINRHRPADIAQVVPMKFIK